MCGQVVTFCVDSHETQTNVVIGMNIESDFRITHNTVDFREQRTIAPLVGKITSLQVTSCSWLLVLRYGSAGLSFICFLGLPSNARKTCWEVGRGLNGAHVRS